MFEKAVQVEGSAESRRFYQTHVSELTRYLWIKVVAERLAKGLQAERSGLASKSLSCRSTIGR